MWRYLAGGVATLLMVAAGWLLFNGRATPETKTPQAATILPAKAPVDDVGPVVPEATERTREEKRFDRYDKDRDGRITRDEYLQQRRKAFGRLDANGDGRLSFDEWATKTTTKFVTADKDKSGAMDRGEFAVTKVQRKTGPRCVCPQARSTAVETGREEEN